jgi:hypothetical protein
MSEISSEAKAKIIAALEKAGARMPCPRCGNQKFSLLGGYLNHSVQTELTGLTLGGPSIPSVVVVCDRCGFISQHALGALGLLPRSDASSGNKP